MSDSKALTIGATSVRQVGELYSLNDLHKASGGEAKHQPGYFMRRDETQALIAELEISPEMVSSANSANSQSYQTKEGRNGGTYACKELVIAYAAWISAAFHLKVIRVFLAVATPFGAQSAGPEQVALARRAALLATTHVYKTVFEAVMEGRGWQLNKYMLYFDITAEEGTVPRMQAADKNSYVLPITGFYKAIEKSVIVDPQTLANLATVCTNKLGHMARCAMPTPTKALEVAA